MKKPILLACLTISALVLLVQLLSIASVSAFPVWETHDMYPWINYKIIGTGLHVASDPLFDSTTVNTIPPFDPGASAHVKGWVTFNCLSDLPKGDEKLQGFDFFITVKDVPKGTYDVMAYPTIAVMPDGTTVPSDDLGVVTSYLLRTFSVKGNRQRAQLHGFYDLDPGFYAWKITVELAGTPVAETHFADPVDFVVIS